jgi:hypothetical protein
MATVAAAATTKALCMCPACDRPFSLTKTAKSVPRELSCGYVLCGSCLSGAAKERFPFAIVPPAMVCTSMACSPARRWVLRQRRGCECVCDARRCGDVVIVDLRRATRVKHRYPSR